jgi:DNA-binding beta-propeller fold protein YncE
MLKNKALSAAAAEPIGAWDLSYAYYDPPESLAWDISTAVYVQNFSVASQATFPSDIFFKPDGTKMYVLDDTGNDVNEYNLTTAWNVTTASFVQTFSVATKETSPEGLAFKPDGTKMYVIGRDFDNVHEYDLSTAWSVSSAVFNQSFSVASQETAPTGLRFKPDGTKMYVIGSTGDDVNEYDLSTAWDISTASYLQNFSVSSQFSLPFALDFKTDGTKMYVMGANTAFISEYALSTPWDISSAVHSINKSITGNTVRGVFFKPDGAAFYYVDSDLDAVYQYSIGGFSVAAQETSPQAISFKPDGTKMYVAGTSGDDVNEYSLSTAWDTSTATYVRVFDTGTVTTAPKGIFFKPDGTKLYTIGDNTDAVAQWSLSTPWDVSTTTYDSVLFSVSAQELNPQDLFFSPNGTKMYVCGISGVDVNEYTLGTAWDVSTASYIQNFSVSGQVTSPQGLSFSSDGTKMFVVTLGVNTVFEYSLGTAWDVSTASYSGNSFNVASQETDPRGMFFKSDGTQMFIIGDAKTRVYSYTLGVQP